MKFNTGVQITGQIYWHMRTGDGYLELPQDKNSIQQVLSYIENDIVKYTTGEYPFGIQRVVDDFTNVGSFSFTKGISVLKYYEGIEIPPAISGKYTRDNPALTRFTGAQANNSSSYIDYHPSTGYYLFSTQDKYTGVLFKNPYLNNSASPLFEDYWSWESTSPGPLEVTIADAEDIWEDAYSEPENTPKINSSITGVYRRNNYSENFTGSNGNRIDRVTNSDWFNWSVYNGTTDRIEYHISDSDINVNSYIYPEWFWPDQAWTIKVSSTTGNLGGSLVLFDYDQSIFRTKDYRTTGIFSLGSDAFVLKKGGKGLKPNGQVIDLTNTITFDKENSLIIDARNTFLNSSNVLNEATLNSSNNLLAGISNKVASTQQSSILAGQNNNLENSYTSSIGAGAYNLIKDSFYSSIGGGSTNSLRDGRNSFIAAGGGNTIYGSYNFIGASDNSSINGSHSFIGGGGSNTIRALGGHPYNFIGAGAGNRIFAGVSFIGGGLSNSIGTNATISLGERYMSYGFIGGGLNNFLLGFGNVLVGGVRNRNVGWRSFVGAGQQNHIDIDRQEGDLFASQSKYPTLLESGLVPNEGAIVGGSWNRLEAASSYSFIGAGYANKISYSKCSFIPGGSGNWIAGAERSFVIGSRGTIKNMAGGKVLQFNTLNGWQEYNVPDIENKGVGIINDGYWPVYNSFLPKSLHLGFTHGLVLQPFVNLQSAGDTTQLSVEDFIESVNEINKGLQGHRSGEYGEYIETLDEYGDPITEWGGYTGWTEVRADYLQGRSKFINIGTYNVTKNNFVDISGFFPEENMDRNLLRVYNPSVVIGALNSGGHQNILLGVSNVSFYTPVEEIETGYHKGKLDEALFTGLKTLNRGPWPFSRATWPYYQGQTTLIGHENQSTGRHVSVLGSSNVILENQGPTAIVGVANFLLPEKSRILANSSGYATGIDIIPHVPGDFIFYKQNTTVLGFSNQENLGTNTNTVGSDNTSYSNYSNIIGYKNITSGGKLNVIGGENVTYGAFNNNYGYFNVLGGGLNNSVIGFNNIIVNQGSGAGVNMFNSNILMGERNTIAGSSSVILGVNNRFGVGSGYNFAETILIGVNNIAEKGSNILLGNYNRTSGTFSSILGFNNLISGNGYNGAIGTNNIVNGADSYALGTKNKVNAHGGIALGREAYSYNKNQISVAGGALGTSWPGSAQKTTLFWKGITSGAQIMELTLDGVNHNNNYVSGKAIIPSGTFWHGTLNIVAVETGLNSYRTELKSVIAVNKGSVVATPEQKTITSKFIGVGASGWGVAAVGNNTYKSLDVTASGQANKIIYWNVIGEFNELFVPTTETIAVDKYINNEIVSTIIANGIEWYPSEESAVLPPIETNYPPNMRGPAPGDYY